MPASQQPAPTIAGWQLADLRIGPPFRPVYSPLGHGEPLPRAPARPTGEASCWPINSPISGGGSKDSRWRRCPPAVEADVGGPMTGSGPDPDLSLLVPMSW